MESKSAHVIKITRSDFKENLFQKPERNKLDLEPKNQTGNYQKKVNYLIATWAGKDTKRSALKKQYPEPKDNLVDHLEQLSKLNHNLSQITIIRPKCPEDQAYSDYYQYQHLNFLCPVIEIECINFGYSNGQWMTAYETYQNQFDYYICVEDDYCPRDNHFDQILLEYYFSEFPNNIGKLCGFMHGYPYTPEHKLPIHYDSVVMLSYQTLETLYQFPRWNGDPKSYLGTQIYTGQSNKDLHAINSLKKMIGRKKTIGGFYQVMFSCLFTESNIPIKCIPEAVWPYYDDHSDNLWYLHNGKTSKETQNSQYFVKLNELKNIIFMPIQMLQKNMMKRTNSKQVVVLVIGNHRSGTSALTGCLKQKGINLGTNEAMVKNKYNMKGYFENLTILHFNEKVLKSIGSSWKDYRPITKKQLNLMLNFVDELMEIIRKEYFDHFLFAIKDPRIIFLYPLYYEALDRLKIKIKVIYIDRPFEQICSSLKRVQKLPIEQGRLLCQKYKLRGQDMMSKIESLNVYFDELMNDPINVMKKVDQYLDIGLIKDNGHRVIESFIDPKLRNFR